MKRAACLILPLVLLVVFLMPAAQAEKSDGPRTTLMALRSAQRIPLVFTGSRSEIDATHRDDGYLSIRYLRETSKKLKIKVIKLKPGGGEEEAYIYDLNNRAKSEIFSLTQGNGTYLIKVLENIDGNRYAVVQTQNIETNLISEFAPFLIPIQNINYTSASKAVLKAQELTAKSRTDLDKVQEIYKYIVLTITYDYNKANKVMSGALSGYIPTVDTVLDSKTGICFDYSSLMAAMLRSQGIPTKLIMGYVAPNNAYHAWNEVYITGRGWIRINSTVFFDGVNWSRMDTTFAAANKSGRQTAFIGNGENYAPLFQY
jgi:hypothetical protein